MAELQAELRDRFTERARSFIRAESIARSIDQPNFVNISLSFDRAEFLLHLKEFCSRARDNAMFVRRHSLLIEKGIADSCADAIESELKQLESWAAAFTPSLDVGELARSAKHVAAAPFADLP